MANDGLSETKKRHFCYIRTPLNCTNIIKEIGDTDHTFTATTN